MVFAALATALGVALLLSQAPARLTPALAKATLQRLEPHRNEWQRRPVLRRLLPWAQALGDWLARRPQTHALKQNLHERLKRLGWPLGLNEAEWLGLMSLAAILTAIMAGALLDFAAALPAAIVAGYAPWYWLKRRLQQQEQTLLRLTPAWLETLALHLAAGADLSAALQRQAQGGSDNILKQHVRSAMRLHQAGESLDNALKNLEANLAWPWLQPAIAALRDALQGGAPLAPLCRQHAAVLHERRYETAERRAAAAAVQLLAPLLLIFAAVLLLLLGPLLLQMLGGY